ncbi:hypothetical protein [Paenibacillus xylanilyticus]|uniref:Uncharacterized protein n=2 Tax=Paenibacillus TaxID=44249 RepID=A0A7Y6C3F5_9BACL|nr:hypothetical protein [Paenibacillus xylanilyticus]NUU79471.1 hypothetical protein [Paenibacillus xylanilyticus]
MSQNTQQLMLFCTAIVLFVTACLYGQQSVSVLSSALSSTMNTTENMEGRMSTTLNISKPLRYSGAEVLHTVRQMTGTPVEVHVDGNTYAIDPLINKSATIPVSVSASYRPEFIRSESGELLKIAFWKEASIN